MWLSLRQFRVLEVLHPGSITLSLNFLSAPSFVLFVKLQTSDYSTAEMNQGHSPGEHQRIPTFINNQITKRIAKSDF